MLQASPRNHGASLGHYITVAPDIADISRCLQGKLGFLFVFSTIQLSVYKWALAESFLPSHPLSTRGTPVPRDREHVARTVIPESADNLLLYKRKLFWLDVKGYEVIAMPIISLLLWQYWCRIFFFLNCLFSFQFPTLVTRSWIFGHSKLTLTSLQSHWIMHAEAPAPYLEPCVLKGC